jgi:hypothetical protein
MRLNDIVELENIEVYEDNHHVLEFGVIDFRSIENADDFSLGDYKVNYYEKNYNNAEITYSIYQNGEVVDSGLSETEVIEFLKRLEKKYRDYKKKENKEKSLLEQRKELLRKEEKERIKKEKQTYFNAYEKYSKIMKDEEFKEILRKTLVEKGAADIPTCCLCGQNGCIDANILKNYFEKEIKKFKKEGIYVKFTWNCIEFSLYKNKGYSSYSIVRDEETDKFKVEYHFI